MNRQQRRNQHKPQAGVRVRAAVAYVHPGEVSAAFAYCMMRSLVSEIGSYGAPPAVIAQRCASGQLVEARNEVVDYFLKTDVEWLWCVDADMGFPHDTLTRLLAHADPTERPVVGALCFGLKKQGADDPDTQAVTLRAFPTLYVWQETDDDAGFQVVTDYPRDALVQVAGTGAACFVVHRSVLERMRDKFGACWFDRASHPKGRTFGEDLSFFVRVAACDIPVFVDTSLRTSHDKGGVFLTEQVWDDQQSLLVGVPGDVAVA